MTKKPHFSHTSHVVLGVPSFWFSAVSLFSRNVKVHFFKQKGRPLFSFFRQKRKSIVLWLFFFLHNIPTLVDGSLFSDFIPCQELLYCLCQTANGIVVGCQLGTAGESWSRSRSWSRSEARAGMANTSPPSGGRASVSKMKMKSHSMSQINHSILILESTGSVFLCQLASCTIVVSLYVYSSEKSLAHKKILTDLKNRFLY